MSVFHYCEVTLQQCLPLNHIKMLTRLIVGLTGSTMVQAAQPERCLDTFVVKGLRKILRVLWTVMKTNEWVFDKTGVRNELLKTVNADKLAYYGYTTKKQRSCLEKEIMQEQCHVYAGEEDHVQPGYTALRLGQDSPCKSQSE